MFLLKRKNMLKNKNFKPLTKAKLLAEAGLAFTCCVIMSVLGAGAVLTIVFLISLMINS
jgi:hypothetical protein